MISEEILGDVDAAIKEIMKKENIGDYRYEIEGQSEAGDNYMGEVIFLRVEPEDEKEDRPYHLVMKTSKRLPELREALPIALLYNRELFMYSDIFPAYRKFIQEVRPDFEFEFVPKVYWINKESRKETIVMENLKATGFKLHNRKKTWNLQHSLFAMKHYGNLHALSMALRDQKPEVFEDLKKNLGDVSQGFTENLNMRQFYEKPFQHAMSLLKKNGRGDLVQKYDGFLDKAIDLLTAKAQDESDKVAICHMDCWSNNFMFKYENGDESNPIGIRLLDFQLSVCDSPAKDLSYNIYATLDNSCLTHFDELMQTYHDSLTQSLKSLGSDPSKFFSMEDLTTHWRKYGLYGLIFVLTIIKIELIEKDDAPKIENMANNENIMDVFDVKVSDQEEYDRRILDVYVHFGDKFL